MSLLIVLRRDTVFIQSYIPARLIEVVKSTSQGRQNRFSSLSSQKQNPRHKRQIKLGENGTVCKKPHRCKRCSTFEYCGGLLQTDRKAVGCALQPACRLPASSCYSLKSEQYSSADFHGVGRVDSLGIGQQPVRSPTPVRFSEPERFGTSVETSAGKAGTVKEQHLF